MRIIKTIFGDLYIWGDLEAGFERAIDTIKLDNSNNESQKYLEDRPKNI